MKRDVSKRMAKILATVVVLICIGFTAASAVNYINMAVSPDVIYVNGVRLNMFDPVNNVFLENVVDYSVSRTFIPLRLAAEATGAEVTWENGRIDIKTPRTDFDITTAEGINEASDYTGHIYRYEGIKKAGESNYLMFTRPSGKPVYFGVDLNFILNSAQHLKPGKYHLVYEVINVVGDFYYQTKDSRSGNHLFKQTAPMLISGNMYDHLQTLPLS